MTKEKNGAVIHRSWIDSFGGFFVAHAKLHANT